MLHSTNNSNSMLRNNSSISSENVSSSLAASPQCLMQQKLNSMIRSGPVVVLMNYQEWADCSAIGNEMQIAKMGK